MGKVLWKIVNILCILTSLASLLLQIIAVAVGSWKETDVNMDRFDPLLLGVYLHRRTGLLNSRIGLENVHINEDFQYQTTNNRYPIAVGNRLGICLDGPGLRRVLTVCDPEFRSNECQCKLLPHWTGLAVLELLALPMCALLVVCCFLLRTYPQRFLKTVTLILSALSALVVMVGFILIFQFWDLEVTLLSNLLPYILRAIVVHNYQASFEQGRLKYRHFDHAYTYDNINIFPSWSAFISLACFIGLAGLTFLLILSWLIDMRQSKKEKHLNVPGTTAAQTVSNATYRPIRS